MFFDAVRYHGRSKSVKTLDLLINDTILLEVSVDDGPLVIGSDLLLTKFIFIFLGSMWGAISLCVHLI